MTTERSMRALQAANPRNQPGFDAWIERLDTLREEIATTQVPARRRRSQLDGRRRMIGLSACAAAALAAAAVVVGLTLTAASPPSAYAAAKKALAATAAASSGTLTGTVSHDGSSYTLDTTRWNGDSIEVTPGDRSEFGPDQALLLVDGAAYVEQADGTWLHYASVSGVGPKVGPIVELAQNNVAGNTAGQILSRATNLTQTTQPDGSTIYTGTIPDTAGDPGIDPSDDTILRMIAKLSNGADNEPGAPGGYHNGLGLNMTVGADGFVRQVSLTYQQQDTGSPETSAVTDGSYTWTVSYSQLGSTPAMTPPATSTLTPPVIWSPGTACTAPCGG